MSEHIFFTEFMIPTSQWLKMSCGLANPDVCLRISAAKAKLSMTGSTAVTLKVAQPSCWSPCKTRPWRRPNTAYILPAITKMKIHYLDAIFQPVIIIKILMICQFFSLRFNFQFF
jgi:hypothetical protein